MDIDPILKRIRCGDKHAFAAVVERYQRPLFGFFGRMGLAQGLAEDLAQETFLRAWRNLGQFDPELGAFSTWLFAIARNLALNELSRATNRREIRPPEDAPEPECERPQPPEALALAQRRRRLDLALQLLPAAERCVLALAYLEDFDAAQIAGIEGCTAGAVKTRLHRARRKLYELLEKKDDA